MVEEKAKSHGRREGRVMVEEKARCHGRREGKESW